MRQTAIKSDGKQEAGQNLCQHSSTHNRKKLPLLHKLGVRTPIVSGSHFYRQKEPLINCNDNSVEGSQYISQDSEGNKFRGKKGYLNMAISK